MVLAALAWLLLAHPYEGLCHDGILYFGQVLNWSSPAYLAVDPFFAGGSQNDYSIYAPIVALGYHWFGISATHLGLLLACWTAAITALLCWLQQLGLQRSRYQIFGLVAVAVSSPFYGGLHVFGLLEPYLTARTLAEPLVIASLVFLTRDRLASGLALQLAAAVIHPLMALPAIAATWILAAWRDRRWLWLLLSIPTTCALAAMGLAPTTVLQRFDDSWWQLVAKANMQVVLANWSGSDWLVAATDALVIGLAMRLAPSLQGRRLLSALLGSAASLLAVAAIGSDVLHFALITQIQPWRALWLIHLAAWSLAPYVAWALWQRDGLWRLSAASLVLVLASAHVRSLYAVPALTMWGVCTLAACRGWPATNGLRRLGMGACAAGVVALSLSHVNLRLEQLYWNPTDHDGLERLSILGTEPLTALLVTGLLVALASHGRPWRAAVLALSVGAFGFALLHWDRRDAFSRATESPPANHPFKQVIPSSATVFWPEHLEAVWGLLERTSHYNRQQGAGVLFNRATAQLIAPRREAYEAITEDRESCRTGAWLSGGSAKDLVACDTPSSALVHQLCTGRVHPDYLVFASALPVSALAIWDSGRYRFYLYACSQFASVPH